MTTAETLRTLRELRKRLNVYLNSVDRKRSMRPSEKAMAKALYRREVEALDQAISLIEIKVAIDQSKVLPT